MDRRFRLALPLLLALPMLGESSSAQCRRLFLQPANSSSRASALEADEGWLVAGFAEDGTDFNGRVTVYRRDASGSFAPELTIWGDEDDFLGSDVAIEGPIFVIGAPGQTVAGGPGALHVYELGPGGTWSQDAIFGAQEAGHSVSLHGDWSWSGSASGSATRLVRAPGGWMLDGIEPDAGISCGMDSTHVIFAHGTGSVAYELSGGTWTHVQDLPPAYHVDIDGDRAVIADFELVRVLEWNGAQWVQTFEIDASDAPIHGGDLALSGDLLAFGQHSSEFGMFSGRLVVFRHEAGTWELLTSIVQEEQVAFQHFGTSCEFMEGELLVGSTARIHVYELPAWLSTFCHCDSAPCGNADWVRGCANSTGRGASLSVCGSASASADDLTLTAGLLPPGAPGLVFMGAGRIELPFGDGHRCVGAGGVGTFRFPVRAADGAGRFVEGPGLVAHSRGFPPGGAIDAGETWHFQAWYRDPGGPCGSTFNLSHGVTVPFGP